jgi:hypothetical protein
VSKPTPGGRRTTPARESIEIAFHRAAGSGRAGVRAGAWAGRLARRRVLQRLDQRGGASVGARLRVPRSLERVEQGGVDQAAAQLGGPEARRHSGAQQLRDRDLAPRVAVERGKLARRGEARQARGVGLEELALPPDRLLGWREIGTGRRSHDKPNVAAHRLEGDVTLAHHHELRVVGAGAGAAGAAAGAAGAEVVTTGALAVVAGAPAGAAARCAGGMTRTITRRWITRLISTRRGATAADALWSPVPMTGSRPCRS